MLEFREDHESQKTKQPSGEKMLERDSLTPLYEHRGCDRQNQAYYYS